MKQFLTFIFALMLATEVVAADESHAHQIVFGDENAPVTITEYTSLTCHHCADFHLYTLPVIKQKYINTGKLKLIVVPLPLDKDALTAFKLVHSLPKEQQNQAMAKMYQAQSQWIGKPPEKAAELLGLSKDQCEAAINNKELETTLLVNAYTIQKDLKVDATPIFVCNGKLHEGAYNVQEFDEAYGSLLDGTQNQDINSQTATPAN
jgi:protein-disulfide isomerase